MAETTELPEWHDIQAERVRLGTLDWARRARLAIPGKRNVAEDVAAWLNTPNTDRVGISDGLRGRLHELDYVDAAGKPNEAGAWAKAALDPRNLTSLRIFTRDRDGQRTLILGFDDRQAIVLSCEDGVSWGLDYTDLEAVPELVARWLPIAPAYSFDVIDRTITEAELEHAITRPSPPQPADGTEATRFVDHLLEQPWSQFMLQIGPFAPQEYAVVEGWGVC